MVYMSLWGMVICMFVLGLAIGVVLAVGMLLYFQLRAILRNRTGIEDWILEKAMHRRDSTEKPFIYPYNLGRWNNFAQVINVWCEPNGDGIVWPVREECNQYTLTIEQLAQKAEKRARSLEYQIVEAYSGWWFPCTKGFGVCCHPPCTDESRISLQPGDEVLVTRWKKYWLYGERINLKDCSAAPRGSSSFRHRGWFPRRCAVQLFCLENDLENTLPSDAPNNQKQNQRQVENKKNR